MEYDEYDKEHNQEPVLYIVSAGKYFRVTDDRARAFQVTLEWANECRARGRKDYHDKVRLEQYKITWDRNHTVMDFVQNNSFAYTGKHDPSFNAEAYLRPVLYEPDKATEQQIVAFYDGLMVCVAPDSIWVSREQAERIYADMPDYPASMDPYGIMRTLEISAMSYD